MSKLTPREAKPGYVAKLGDGTDRDCKRCAFGPNPCYNEFGNRCTGGWRDDGCHVYFVELPKKPTKPRRKAHVVWVGTSTDSQGVVHRLQNRTRRLMRDVLAMYRSHGWQTRGPVKVVLP